MGLDGDLGEHHCADTELRRGRQPGSRVNHNRDLIVNGGKPRQPLQTYGRIADGHQRCWELLADLGIESCSKRSDHGPAKLIGQLARASAAIIEEGNMTETTCGQGRFSDDPGMATRAE